MVLADAWNQIVGSFRALLAAVFGIIPIVSVIWLVIKVKGSYQKDGIDHTLKGKFDKDKTHLISGGHGNANIRFMKRHHWNYRVVKTLPNGVRLGNIERHNRSRERRDMGHAWFPRHWSSLKIIVAGWWASRKSKNKAIDNKTTDPVNICGVGVKVNKTDGKINSVFPDNPEAKK